MKKRHFKTLFSTILDTSEENMNAYREEYAYQYDCEPNEVSDDDIYDWMREDVEIDWDNFISDVDCYDAKHHNATYTIEGGLRLWNGVRIIDKKTNSLREAIDLCLGKDSQFDFIVKEDQFGNMMVEYHHHDGKNYFEIKRKEPNLKNVNFRKEMGYC